MMTPDRIAASATGVGVGLGAFVITWIVLNRLTASWLPVPDAPIVSLTSAALVSSGKAPSGHQTRRVPGPRSSAF